MRSLWEIELSWENISWCKSRKSPIFVATVARNLGTFLTSKIMKNFLDIPQDVSYNFHVLSFSRFFLLDAQKNQKPDCVQGYPRKIHGLGILYIFGSWP